MKELSIEEKAKRYDETIEKARQLCAYPTTKPFISDLQDLFPELKESEDERIRKEILVFIKRKKSLGSVSPEELGKSNSWLAWLEKQGEHANFRNKIQIGDKVTRNQDGVLVNLSQLKRVAKPADVVESEKQGEQNLANSAKTCKDVEQKFADDIERKYNPCYNMSFEEAQEYISNRGFDIPWTDCDVFVDFRYVTQTIANILCWADNNPKQKSVVPKFKVGDWITFRNGDIGYIFRITDKDYEMNTGERIPFYCKDEMRLWTIQDAKAGDVLAWNDSKCIAIFKNIYDEDSFNSYGFVGGCTGTFESRQSYHDIEGAHPAAKEQRDTLMKAMADAGYEWDADTLELKKIEQKPVEWSEKDEDTLRCIIDALDSLDIRTNTNGEHEDHTEEINWLKNRLKFLIPMHHWKPSDEHMNALNYVVNLMASSERPTENDLYYNILKSLRQQLKKVKG